jgi:hypothetical protein
VDERPTAFGQRIAQLRSKTVCRGLRGPGRPPIGQHRKTRQQAGEQRKA